ncbi:MAG: isochorismatase family protein [Candidatus Tectomicrobia bacterium]|uniref:Isochorismatase family protein n=1 Tax=Tectimicrobiota bacterium TaxID=2528274 RepID=A0A933GKX4_UNCTE|nr:isochorismatase family protein [Candidatus Tectomicrobia bacterium]
MLFDETLVHYRQVGIGGRMGFGKRPCILVIDFQKGFTKAQYPLAGNLDNEVHATREVLEVARKKNVPIVFTVIAFDGSGYDGGRYVDKIPTLKTLIRGTPLVELDDRLMTQPTEIIIEKKHPSAFFGTPLTSVLNSSQIDTTIICGCVTSSCVRATALDSMQLGYYTIIPRQCVGDRVRGPHEANLFDLDTKIADVVDKDHVIEYLQRLPFDR